MCAHYIGEGSSDGNNHVEPSIPEDMCEDHRYEGYRRYEERSGHCIMHVGEGVPTIILRHYEPLGVAPRGGSGNLWSRSYTMDVPY